MHILHLNIKLLKAYFYLHTDDQISRTYTDHESFVLYFKVKRYIINDDIRIRPS